MVNFSYKIVVPQRPRHLIPRPHLTNLLSAILERQLVVLSAPAGYGKTSLLIDFATSLPSNSPPVCWYLLDVADQNIWTFLSYLVNAITHRLPAALPQTCHLLSGQVSSLLPSVIATLTREIYTLTHDLIVVIDDWHLVEHIPEINDTVTELLLRCPNCHLMLASRSYPSLQNIMLLTARRQVSSFNEQHLRFGAVELAAALTAEYGLPITADQAEQLTAQTDGWITGALLSFQVAQINVESGPPFAAGANRQVFRFLLEQVFQHQSAEIRRFLLESALFEDLVPATCDALFGRRNSRFLIDTLVQRHLFISEIRPGVLRYQSLFREFLLDLYPRLDPTGYAHAVIRVADSYAAQGQWSLAFERYLQAGAQLEAQRMIAMGGERLYANGHLETLERWFDVLEPALFTTQLHCLKARVLLDRGRHAEAHTVSDIAALQASAEELPQVLLVQAQVARVIGRYDQAIAYATAVRVSSSDDSQRAQALRTIAISHHRLGQTGEAIAELQEALQLQRSRRALDPIAHLQRDLGICYAAVGRLQEAAEHFASADAYWESIGNLGLRAMSLNSRGSVLHLMGCYPQTLETLLMALRYACEAGLPDYQTVVLSNLGDLYSDLQLWEHADSAYGDALANGGSAHMQVSLMLSRARMLARQQRYDEARRTLQQIPGSPDGHNALQLRLLQIGVALGSAQHTHIVPQLDELIAEFEQTDYLIDLARAYLLRCQVLLRSTTGDDGQFLTSLDQALAITRRMGHDAFLVIEMLHMRGVLRRATACGWSLADIWRQRIADLGQLAHSLCRDDQRPVLTVRALGIDQILLNATPVNLGWHKAREVLYYLLEHPDGVKIDVLREAIWPDLPLERNRDALRSAIYQLRSVLPEGIIQLHRRQVYQIDPLVAQVDYDARNFLSRLENISDTDALLEALDLYHGPYLDTAESEWCAVHRAFLERRFLQALAAAGQQLEAMGCFADALHLYDRSLAIEPLNEVAHAGVMRCHAGLGNRHAAIHQYHRLRALLDSELGLCIEQNSAASHLYQTLIEAP